MRFIFYCLSLLPFRALYCLSDFIYLFIYKVAGYRLKVVRRNLSLSFPEKSKEELRETERGFYHWLCDYFLEAIKLLSISEEEIRKRLTVKGLDKLEECFAKGQSCAAFLGHYCNWEWLSCMALFLPKDSKAGLIYHPLKNGSFDRLFNSIRSHSGGVTIPKKDILRFLSEYRKTSTKYLFGYISDQAPKYENTHLWITFMNQETAVFTGAERIARMEGNAVFYVEMSRPKRGYYECRFIPMSLNPEEEKPNFLTEDFFRRLEETIRREPTFYLWTHNRWKRTKEEFDRLYYIENGRVIRK